MTLKLTSNGAQSDVRQPMVVQSGDTLYMYLKCVA